VFLKKEKERKKKRERKREIPHLFRFKIKEREKEEREEREKREKEEREKRGKRERKKREKEEREKRLPESVARIAGRQALGETLTTVRDQRRLPQISPRDTCFLFRRLFWASRCFVQACRRTTRRQKCGLLGTF
jgi:hypothetical protein